MKNCVIYARYSSDRQTEQSIEGQLRVCYEFAARNDLNIVHEYIDRAMTGTNDNRKDFQQMLSDSEHTKEWEICLVYALDRFGRNSIEQAINKYKLQKTGKIVISATQKTSRNIDGSQNLDGIILENMYVGMAEYYSAELSQKVRRGLNESRIKGNFTGGYLLFGYKKSGDKKTGVKVEIDENQAAIVKRLFEEFVSGRLVKDLIGEFNEEGVLYRGKPLGKTTVYNMLRNEKYIGVYRFGDEVYTNIYPAIIPETLFNLARAKIEINQYGKHVEGVEYLLKRKITCGYCRKPVSSESGTSKSGAVMRYYKCSGKRKDKTCPNIPVRKELLEQIVIDATYEALATPELIENIADRIMSAHKKRMQGASCLNLLEDQLVAIDNSIANLIKAMEQGIISQATKDRLNSLEQEKFDIQNKIAIEKQKEQLIVQRDDIVKYLKSAIKKEPRLMIQLIIKEVVLYNDKIEIHFNYTEAKRPDDEKHRAFSFYSFEKKVLVDQHRLNKPPIEKNYEIILSI